MADYLHLKTATSQTYNIPSGGLSNVIIYKRCPTDSGKTQFANGGGFCAYCVMTTTTSFTAGYVTDAGTKVEAAAAVDTGYTLKRPSVGLCISTNGKYLIATYAGADTKIYAKVYEINDLKTTLTLIGTQTEINADSSDVYAPQVLATPDNYVHILYTTAIAGTKIKNSLLNTTTGALGAVSAATHICNGAPRAFSGSSGGVFYVVERTGGTGITFTWSGVAYSSMTESGGGVFATDYHYGIVRLGAYVWSPYRPDRIKSFNASTMAYAKTSGAITGASYPSAVVRNIATDGTYLYIQVGQSVRKFAVSGDELTETTGTEILAVGFTSDVYDCNNDPFGFDFTASGITGA